MPLVSRASPSYCLPTDISRCKTGQNVLFGVTNSIEAFKQKETCFRFCSLSCNSIKTSWVPREWVRIRRENQLVVAASPPTEDTVIAAEPLTKEDLVGYLASGCKPKEKWRYKYVLINIVLFH